LQRCAASYLDNFGKHKIIFCESSKNFQCVLDSEEYFLNKTLFFIVGNSLKYLTAFLNSRLFAYCFKDNFPDLQGDSRSFSKEILCQIPIKHPSREKNPKLEKEFNKIVDSIQTARKVGKETIELERRLDLMIYKLYELSYDEARIIDPELGSRLSRAEYTI